MAIPETASLEEREQRWREFQHDLRNYLSVIVTFSELLSRSVVDAKTLDALGAINESAKLAINLTENFDEQSHSLSAITSRTSEPTP